MVNQTTVLERLRQRSQHPATLRELLSLLEVAREDRAAFRRILRELVADGTVVRTRGRRYGLAERMDVIAGALSVHPTGYGFVRTDRPVAGVEGDIYVGRTSLEGAMDGDRVIVRVERVKEGGRAEGRIVRVLERRRSTIVGRLEGDSGRTQFVVPFDRRLQHDVVIPPGDGHGASADDIVVVEVVRWPSANRNPVGRVTEVIGRLDEPGVDLEVVVRKHALPDAHSPHAEAEARRLGASVREADLEGRTDFRPLPTVTIDGEHARDFDDAITLERLPKGRFRLGVHIADVSHYVAPGSALDAEALDRGTSVYFPERALHMFPADLATGLCSLNPHVDRLVQSCVMDIDARGDVASYQLHDGVIRSDERMTYTTVNAILEDRDPDVKARYAGLVPLFEDMRTVFERLNARRRRRGAIDFDLPQPEVVLDAAGIVEAILPAERNVAHRLIEEFMLLANETVARHLDRAGVPALYRIHERPDSVKVQEFDDFLASIGHGLGAPPGQVEPIHFQRLVEHVRGRPEERAVAYLMLRTMQKARYDPLNVGHFGLANPCYTHFTSPIRRYPDLIVHRRLRDQRQGRLADEDHEDSERRLAEAGRHCSERERRAEEAERELLQWKKVRFMADKIGDEFDGYVIGVAGFGLFVELIEHFVEGLVHVSSMADDYYHFDAQRQELRGTARKRAYRLGDRVTVQVVKVDLERRQIDLGLTEILEAVRKSRGRRDRRAPVAPTRGRRGAGAARKGGRKRRS